MRSRVWAPMGKPTTRTSENPLRPKVAAVNRVVSSEEPEEDSAPPDLNLAEARGLADSFLNYATRNDTGHIAARYAEQVDYYDRGLVSRSIVVSDKRSYLQRWPEREYERTSDVEIHKSGGEVHIRFNYRYLVENSTRATTGEGWAQLTLANDDGRLAIVGEKGGVYGSAERDPQ